MQDSASLNVLKERYRFEEWKKAATASATDRAQPISFAGGEFPGWRLARQSRRATRFPGARLLVRSTWERRSQAELLGLDVIECDSPAAAREALLRLLGEFQGPHLSATPGIGDVAFATAGETAIVFARGNSVAAVRNAGRHVVPLGNEARMLDELLSPPGGEPKAKRAR